MSQAAGGNREILVEILETAQRIEAHLRALEAEFRPLAELARNPVTSYWRAKREARAGGNGGRS